MEKEIKPIAIVILNWNGADLLERYLPPLLQRTPEACVDYYVADNASTDHSLEVLSRYPEVSLIRLDKNYGFAEGYNRALEALPHSYYILLNSDVEVTQGWLLPLLEYMDSHQEVAACQPKVRSLRSPDCFEYAGAAGGFIDRYGYPFCRGRIREICEKDRGQYDEVTSIFWATGACLMIRRDDYQAVGGLDGAFFAHMEEIDLCWRLRARGRLLVCLPQSVVYHLGGATLKQENPFKTYLNFRNNLLMLYKNLPEKELHRVLSCRLVLDLLAAILFLVQGQVKNAWAVCKAYRDYRRMRCEMRAKRMDNQAIAVLEDIPERVPQSMLVAYYLRCFRTFDQWYKHWK